MRLTTLLPLLCLAPLLFSCSTLEPNEIDWPRYAPAFDSVAQTLNEACTLKDEPALCQASMSAQEVAELLRTEEFGMPLLFVAMEGLLASTRPLLDSEDPEVRGWVVWANGVVNTILVLLPPPGAQPVSVARSVAPLYPNVERLQRDSTAVWKR